MNKKSQLSLILDKFNFKSYVNTIGREELYKSGLGDTSKLSAGLGEVSDTLFSLSNSPIYTYEFVSPAKFGKVKDIGKHLKVTFEDVENNFDRVPITGISSGVSDVQIENAEKNSFHFRLIGKMHSYNLQGYIKSRESPETLSKSFSIKKALGLNENSIINKNIALPTKSSPSLATYQIFDESLAIGNRQTAELEAFFNLIPTLEFSRAVPIISAKFSLPSKITKNRGIYRQEFNVANNADFLFGSESPEVTKTMDPFRGDTFSKTLINSKAQTAKRTGISTNLDIFLSPQTLVNTEEKYTGLGTEFKGQTKSSFNRTNPVIDKMRPFLSIESFDIDVKPTRGLLSYKTANMNLTLHDRSRMADIAPFLKPDLFGTFGSEISVEYGWAHPDGSSPFGAMLNLMRAREKYMIVNSTFNLQQNGEVKISLSLAMLGATDIINTNVFDDAELQAAIKQFNTLFEKFQNRVTASKNVSANNNVFLDLAREVAGSSGSQRDFEGKLNRLIKNSPSTGSDLSNILKQAAKDLKSQLISIKTKKSNVFQEFEDSINNNYDPYLSYEAMHKLTLVTFENNRLKITDRSNSQKTKKIENYVSFGKVVLSLIGKNLALSQRFNEVQLIFYNTNTKSSYASSINIANLPVNKKLLKKYLSNNIKNTVQEMSLGKLVQAISKRFIEDKSSILYGFHGLYTYDEATGTTRLADGAGITQSSLASSQKEILFKAYYGDDDYNTLKALIKSNKPDSDLTESDIEILSRKVDFIMPKIGFSTEVIYKSNSKQINFDKINVSPEPLFSFKSSNEETDTILRVHIYDKSNTPFQGATDFISDGINDDFTKLNNALMLKRKDLFRDGQVKSLAKLGRTLEDNLKFLNAKAEGGNINIGTKFGAVKETYKKIMPSLTYGSQNSAIINASFQTINEGRLPTVFITRADREVEARQDNGEAGINVGADALPLRVLPTKVDLTTFGCPVINFAQSLFFDFGTGTTIDNLYNVVGIKHTISAGKFESAMTLQYGDVYGKFENRKVTELSLSQIEGKIIANIKRQAAENAKFEAARRAEEARARLEALPNGRDFFVKVDITKF